MEHSEGDLAGGVGRPACHGRHSRMILRCDDFAPLIQAPYGGLPETLRCPRRGVRRCSLYINQAWGRDIRSEIQATHRGFEPCFQSAPGPCKLSCLSPAHCVFCLVYAVPGKTGQLLLCCTLQSPLAASSRDCVFYAAKLATESFSAYLHFCRNDGRRMDQIGLTMLSSYSSSNGGVGEVAFNRVHGGSACRGRCERPACNGDVKAMVCPEELRRMP